MTKSIGLASNTFPKVFVICAGTILLYSFILSASFKMVDDQASIIANRYIQKNEKTKRKTCQALFGDR